MFRESEITTYFGGGTPVEPLHGNTPMDFLETFISRGLTDFIINAEPTKWPRAVDRAIKRKTGNIGIRGIVLAVITGAVIGAAPALIDKFIDPGFSVNTQAPTYHTSFGEVTNLQFLKDK